MTRVHEHYQPRDPEHMKQIATLRALWERIDREGRLRVHLVALYPKPSLNVWVPWDKFSWYCGDAAKYEAILAQLDTWEARTAKTLTATGSVVPTEFGELQGMLF